MKKCLKFLPTNNQVWNTYVINNFNNLRLSLLLFPAILILLIVFFLFMKNAFSIDGYANLQLDTFLYLNSKLSFFPNFQFNITQLGDVAIFLPFLGLFMVYAPKLWESMLTGLVVSGIFSNILKHSFAVPRPGALFDQDSFVITGRAIIAHNSFPSGHSIATFTILTSILFAFMPVKLKFKLFWSVSIILLASIIAFSRVAIGAHFPLDVVFGSIIGYVSALIGIFIDRKFNLLTWLTTKKYYFISIILFSILAIAIINKIVKLNLIIFYFSLASLIVTLFIITCIYVKKEN